MLSLNQASAQAFERGLWRELRRELQKNRVKWMLFMGEKKKRLMPQMLRDQAFRRMVPVVGLEPTRSRPRRILNPLRLPFHHTGIQLDYYTLFCGQMQEKFTSPETGMVQTVGPRKIPPGPGKTGSRGYLCISLRHAHLAYSKPISQFSVRPGRMRVRNTKN